MPKICLGKHGPFGKTGEMQLPWLYIIPSKMHRFRAFHWHRQTNSLSTLLYTHSEVLIKYLWDTSEYLREWESKL